MSFNLNQEKLLCLMVLDDALATRIDSTAGPAYWRAFILEDRETHQVYAQYRFKYEDGKRCWFELRPKNQSSVEAVTEYLRCAVEDVIRTGLEIFGVDTAEANEAIHCHYPPDDQGDPLKTIVWLEQQDLVEISVERKEN